MLPNGKKQPIQGLNSRWLKFSKSICARCNNSTTQKADRSYEIFRDEKTAVVRTASEELSSIENWKQEREVDLLSRVDLARYFGKHLGCALAESKFPIPRRLSKFVGGRSDKICISVVTRVAPLWFQDEAGVIGPLNALGGSFLILNNSRFRIPLAYQSAYMTDGVQFIIKMELSLSEALELRFLYQRELIIFHGEFSNEERKLRGLPYDDEPL